MSRIVVLLCLALICGCGVSVKPTAEAITLSGSVQQAGQVMDGVILNLQPTGEGLPAVLPVSNGQFSGRVIPGKYTWYLSEGEKKGALASIPQGYQEGSLERQFDVSSTTSIDFSIE